ncbi:MAG: nitroreductase family protein, partial [Streptococcus salivarius]|nr:nitroreductase family protein [Streptococcus salivarius]
VQGSPERFISAFSDAMIAAQNVVVAAESLGMGTVYLGSILNDNAKLSELLKLPKYVYPAVGLAVGWPYQEPQLKPRLPRHVIYMENYYQDLENPLEELKDYDAEVHEYYDLRDLNNRVDEFTTQIAKTMDKSVANRANTLKDLQKQGFFID